MKLSVVIPCYNEEIRLLTFKDEWLKFVFKFHEKIFSLFPSIELIFVNDGSKDQTLSILQSLSKDLASDKVSVKIESFEVNRGKGSVVRSGLLRSQGDWVLITDVDLSSPLKELFKLQNSQVDFAFGSRALSDSQITRSQNGLRPQLGRVFNKFMRFMTGIPFLDTQCGFKLIRGDLAREIATEMQENRFAFDVEMILLAHGRGASMKEIAVEWQHQEPSRVSPIKDGIRMAFKVIEFSKRFPHWDSVQPLSFQTPKPSRMPR
ncbi:MAG: glycosyltransferase family 2 protein [Deltaproteobacteria bacterium]|nr:glycosyltransferase family 2 protein [Deltaproteobacteria bacterium]